MIKTFRSLFLVGCTLLLGGCKWMMLNPKGVTAAAEKDLILTAVSLMLIVVIPVIILSYIFARHYRASNKSANYQPRWADNHVLEYCLWAIPIIIIGILGAITWFTTHSLDPYRPLSKDKPLTIQVVALDWKWLFLYPEQKIAAVNEMRVPVGKQVRLYVTADAPMNAIAMPQISGQIYAMPGKRTTLHIKVKQVGAYDGFSANFSGDGFSGMRFKLRGVSPKNFKKWVRHVKQDARSLDDYTYKALVKQSEYNPVAYYTLPNTGLFQQIIKKYMGPDMSPGGKTKMQKHWEKVLGEQA